jgi:UDP-glucose 4-epimerase
VRIVVFGATGNAGTALFRLLSADPEVETIVGVARRLPELELPKAQWRTADIAEDDLGPIVEGADAVVHLAWLIQPSHRESVMRRVNVDGSKRVFAAVGAAGVPAMVYASSVGAYSPGPKDHGVEESWPTEGVHSSFYSRHKAEVERLLDEFEAAHPDTRVVRLRPGLIFRREVATGVRRLFLGPLFAGALLRRGVPVVPDVERLRFQAVHGDDLAEAYALALHREVSGAFNVAAGPVLDPERLAELFRARRVRMPSGVLEMAARASWTLHLQPTPPGWLDLALSVPIMDTGRAERELGWKPRTSATAALADLIDGLRSGAGYPTPPLDPKTSGPFRAAEFRTGVGSAST